MSTQVRPFTSQSRQMSVTVTGSVALDHVACVAVIDRPSRTSGALHVGSAVSSGGRDTGAVHAEFLKAPISVAQVVCEFVAGPTPQKVQRSMGSSASEVTRPHSVSVE